MSNPTRPELSSLAPDAPSIASLVVSLASRDPETAHQAHHAVLALGSSAVPTLLEALMTPDDRLRQAAVQTLGEMRDPAACAAIIRTLEDPQPQVRWQAAEALIKLSRWGLSPLLQALMQHPESVWLREGAHHVLRHWAGMSLDDSITRLLAALEGIKPDLEVPLAAYHVLRAHPSLTSPST